MATSTIFEFMNVIIRASATNVKSSKSAEVGDKWHWKEALFKWFYGSQVKEAVQEIQQNAIEEGGVVLVVVVAGPWMTIYSRNFMKLSSILMVVFKHPDGVNIKMEFI
jgi:hypothetical protein